MPYRRLPNTDQARVRALKAAVEKGEMYNVRDLAITLKTLFEARNFLHRFEAAQIYYTQCYDNQSRASRKHQMNVKTARLYISHFIQVLNFCIARGELKPSARTFYGLDENSSKVPSLLTEQDLLQWGEKIIAGEQNRISNGGGNPIYCPSIALVKVNYENFKENYTRQKQFHNNSARESGNVAQYRNDADALILEVWNEVERYFEGVKDEEEKRYMCEEYGLVYVFRRGEKERIRRRKEAESITLKLF